ncbi:oxidoreductase [Hypoxylon sp. EC38]|nr:oxidoreductase [Hypoxylon sp. EC38]
MASEELFKNIPPFPDDVPTASMSTILLEDLRSGEENTANDILKALCKDLMSVPAEVKMKYQHDITRTFLGFKPLGQAKTETNVPDRYESFNISQDGLMGNQSLQELPLVVHPCLPIIVSYLKHCQDIVALINSTIATQLGLPADTFTSLQSPTQLSGIIIRFLKALASPKTEDLRTALIHHTDFGTITLLANVVGGLQILSPGASPADESAWLWVKPQPGCLIVNLGDAMRYVDKYSVVYLVRPERNASMKRLLDVGGLDDGKDDNLSAWEWEVKKAMAMARPDFVSESKGGGG